MGRQHHILGQVLKCMRERSRDLCRDRSSDQRPRLKGRSRMRVVGVRVGRLGTGAVEAGESPVVDEVSDGLLVGTELVLFIATILAGEGSVCGVN